MRNADAISTVAATGCRAPHAQRTVTTSSPEPLLTSFSAWFLLFYHRRQNTNRVRKRHHRSNVPSSLGISLIEVVAEGNGFQ